MNRFGFVVSFLFFSLLLCELGCKTESSTPAIRTGDPQVNPSGPDTPPVMERRNDAGHLSVDRDNHNFGIVEKEQELKTTFILKNDGKETLEIGDIIPSCICVVVPLSTKVLDPNQSVALEVSFKAPSQPGKSEQAIRVYTKPPALPSMLVLRLAADVKQYVTAQPEPFEITLSEESQPEIVLNISSIDSKPFRILKARIPDQAIELVFDKTRAAPTHVVPVKVDRGKLDRARSQGTIVLQLDHPKLRYLSVDYKIIRPYVAYPSPRRFKGIRPGESLSEIISIVSVFKKPFELGQIESENGYVKVSNIQTVTPYEYKLQLKMTMPADAKQGMLNDYLHVRIKGDKKNFLKILCYGIP